MVMLLATGLVMRHAARSELEAAAEHAARQWAAFAREAVPGLDQALSGRRLTPEAIARLNHLRRFGEVFHFKFFDKNGAEVTLSHRLDMPVSLPSVLHDTWSAPLSQMGVLAGVTHVELTRSSDAGRPAVYSRVHLPLLGADGRVLGAVAVDVDQTAQAQRIDAAFGEVALAVAGVLSALAGMAVWQRQRRLQREHAAEEKVRYLAHHDVLTGALNRASFQEALERAQWLAEEDGPGFAVLSVDIHGFKDVNDTLGHAAGDELLRTAVQRLRETVGTLDPVARLGGDEFAVLQSPVQKPEEVSRVGERIVDALGRPYLISGQPLLAPVSVGAAVYGNDGRDKSELLHKAGQALRRAKQQQQRGCFSFYDAALDQRMRGQREIIHDLRQALYTEELHLNFQPLFERDGRTLGGYEALVRWHHAERGAVPTSEFIALAESSGLIEELGMWVLARACEVASSWPPSLSLAVNLSAAQFRRSEELIGMVGACLEATGLPAHRLELEITESLLMSNTDQVIQTLHRLTEMGVRIAMDDFGTGYSSLAYLWRFPFDKVKIDRVFTQHLGQDPKVDLIVRSIVSLAHSLNIRVNAEGVETVQQLRSLQEHGCDELQGFLLGVPTPASQLTHRGAPEVAGEPKLPRAVSDFAPLDSRPQTL